jgi:hypothetical protein
MTRTQKQLQECLDDIRFSEMFRDSDAPACGGATVEAVGTLGEKHTKMLVKLLELRGYLEDKIKRERQEAINCFEQLEQMESGRIKPNNEPQWLIHMGYDSHYDGRKLIKQ